MPTKKPVSKEQMVYFRIESRLWDRTKAQAALEHKPVSQYVAEVLSRNLKHEREISIPCPKDTMPEY